MKNLCTENTSMLNRSFKKYVDGTMYFVYSYKYITNSAEGSSDMN